MFTVHSLTQLITGNVPTVCAILVYNHAVQTATLHNSMKLENNYNGGTQNKCNGQQQNTECKQPSGNK